MQQVVAQIGSGEALGENEIAQQAVAQTESVIAPQLVAQIASIPWGHICLIMNRCGKDQRKALFYVNQTVLNNWSCAMLLNFIQSDLYARQGKAITNFDRSLPEERSDLAQQITKDSYDFNLDTFIHRTIIARILGILQ